MHRETVVIDVSASRDSHIPEALLVDSEARPFARDFIAPGLDLQLLHADVEGSVFSVRIRFSAGVQLPTHRHTGVVFAYTLSGEWYYLEYSDSPKNRAGSYLYEPPGSTHTLKVTESNVEITDVIFVVTGSMIILDEHGSIAGVLDASSLMNDWASALRRQGDAVPKVIGGSRVGLY